MRLKGARTLLVAVLLWSIAHMSVHAETMVAVAEDGSIVQLHVDGTWEFKYEKVERENQQPVLSEQQLYRLAMTESDDDLWEQYFKHYDGVDIRRTITGIYNYAVTGTGFLNPAIDMRTGVHYDRRDEYIELLLKGAALSNKHELYFMLPQATIWGINEAGIMSNLYFFYELGYRHELRSQFDRALHWYEELRRLYILTGRKLPFRLVGESTLEVIDGKIYTMELKLSK